MAEVTALLARWRDGDRSALDELTPLVYAELRVLAAAHMRHERAQHTLQPTELVHEAYVRLTGIREARFDDRVHFYGTAARVMRRILVDHARQRTAAKRDRNAEVPLDDDCAAGVDMGLDLVWLDEALDALAVAAPQPARVVELRYFGGLSVDEAAACLAISPATVKRYWAFARAWLHQRLTTP